MTDNAWQVHKFGGTSVANADRFRNAATLVEAAGSPVAVVVSAMGGVTDALLEAIELAAAQDDQSRARLRVARDRYLEAAADLLAGDHVATYQRAIERDAVDLEDILRGVWLTRSASEATRDLVSGFGELWSARLLGSFLPGAAWLDAREVLVVRHGETGPAVDWERTGELLSAWLAAHPVQRVVITGYVASDPDGKPTTLKRNGSDYSASIFGALLEASSITIWTDVDGVLSADPRRVPEAEILDSLSYDEAMELAYFGAKVLHPHTMAPAIQGGIPIRIRNALRPQVPGTEIRAAVETGGAMATREAVKGFSSIEAAALISVEGTGMIGVPGVAHRLFGALREVNVSVIMISQASSEHSICFAVPATEAVRAKAAIEQAFYAELHQGQIQTVAVSAPCSIVAAVGDRMVETPGVAARFFGALGSAGVNVIAVAQGSSERNISVVVAGADSEKALRAVHAGFYLSDQTLSLGLIGPGLIGSELLAQLARQRGLLHQRFGIDLRVRGILRSRRMLLDDTGIDPGSWKESFEERSEPADLERFARHVRAEHLPHAALVDCTASDAVAGHYAQWLRNGLHIVTLNKKAGSGPLAMHRELMELSRAATRHYLYETTVGAGLPVLGTLRDLIQTGDRVIAVEGVLSGTLAYLFNTFDGTRPFSEIVRDARERGYTEPDPRDDLSGMDVARKAIILARTLGQDLELGDIPVASLIPEALRDAADAQAFLDGLPAFDDAMETRRREAAEAGEVLRYVATLPGEGSGSPRVALTRYPAGHPFARITGSDNIIAFTTDRYREQPLIVQGPGAGPAVTAAGVFADLLRLASYLGGPA